MHSLKSFPTIPFVYGTLENKDKYIAKTPEAIFKAQPIFPPSQTIPGRFAVKLLILSSILSNPNI